APRRVAPLSPQRGTPLMPIPFRALLLALALAPALGAQSAAAAPLELRDLLAGLARSDRRAAQLPLLERQAALRTRSVDREILPTATAFAAGQYVSDVPSIGGT